MTYETMIGAVAGEPVAAEAVLKEFDGYIDRLCTRPYADDAGRIRYGVDAVRKTQLQGKLLAAMLRFTL